MRNCRIELSAEALKFNYRSALSLFSGEVMPVIKANGYGHGAAWVANTLNTIEQSADEAPPGHYAVINLDEALELREQGVQSKLLLLQGLMPDEDPAVAVQMHCDIAVHNAAQLDRLAQCDCSFEETTLWLKVDTGMGRLGFTLDEAENAYQVLKYKQPKACGLMSHLACADDSRHPLNELQRTRFARLVAQLKPDLTSFANSAGLFAGLAEGTDIARPGIMQYGGAVKANESGVATGLQPVMRFYAPLLSIREFQAGDSVGYGAEYQCPQDMRVGIVGAGYGDGYPRYRRDVGFVAINGHPCAILGRVSMDSIAIDLESITDVHIGDDVELWGENISIDTVAGLANTISYELMCGISNRVRRLAID